DLTPEMVAAAHEVLEPLGVPRHHVWQGSVLSPASFRSPADGFDAAICIGVLPHVPADQDQQVIENLRTAVKPGGLVVLEARNQLFSLFTLNRYTYEFFLRDLIAPGGVLA